MQSRAAAHLWRIVLYYQDQAQDMNHLETEVYPALGEAITRQLAGLYEADLDVELHMSYRSTVWLDVYSHETIHDMLGPDRSHICQSSSPVSERDPRGKVVNLIGCSKS